MKSDYLASLGYLSLVMRLKRLSDKMVHDGRRLYRNLEMNIEPNWFAVFMLLEDRGAMTVTQLADVLGFSHPSIVTIVNKMTRAGYIESGKSDGDNRKRIMRLSDKAIGSLPEFKKVWAAGTASMKRMLPETDVLEILSLLEGKIAESGFAERTREVIEQQGDVIVFGYSPPYAADFSRLNYEWIKAAYTVEDHDREQLNYPQEQIIDKGGEIFFAEIGGEVVGTVAMIPEERDTFELAKMAVSGGHRGTGIGDSLMEACIAFAKEQGIPRIVLDSNRKQVPAIRLYKKFGFSEIPLSPNTLFERADIRMEYIVKINV